MDFLFFACWEVAPPFFQLLLRFEFIGRKQCVTCAVCLQKKRPRTCNMTIMAKTSATLQTYDQAKCEAKNNSLHTEGQPVLGKFFAMLVVPASTNAISFDFSLLLRRRGTSQQYDARFVRCKRQWALTPTNTE